LGQGGGYYDATLTALRSARKISSIGLAYDQQFWTDMLPSAPLDQHLDAVVTPSRYISLPLTPASGL
jgi:5-formyltetrahydrofolate cyclo-ligase